MPGIQANANFARAQGAQNPQQVSRPAGEQMREHIFEYKTDTQPPGSGETPGSEPRRHSGDARDTRVPATLRFQVRGELQSSEP